MALSLARKLIESHLVDGEMQIGEEIALTMDQTLTQDATGTLVMLELEAMQLDRVRTEVSAQYVDHNLIQADHKNADDHLFLKSACERYGIWYSRPGNGISHAVHMERFGKPGKSLLGSDSHTPAAGAMGMLAIGAGSVDVAMAMAGQPFYTKMPEIWGVKLTGKLPAWVSAKDVILEMLRRHGVSGGNGRLIEYHGAGLKHLSAMDRHVIANMGTELGAITTVFPADAEVKRFLQGQGRGDDYRELRADGGCSYDVEEEIDLSSLVPLIAKPSSPDNVVPVSEIAGEAIYQAYIGSSANPGYRDFAIVAKIVEKQMVDSGVSFDINPSTRAILETLSREGLLTHLIHAGARLHQAGCNGCIGMGQAPASDQNSLRTVPRNFPDRSGTKDDRVFLCSPETAAASALKGRITDPRSLSMTYPSVHEPEAPVINREALLAPPGKHKASKVELIRGPNIKRLPDFKGLPKNLKVPVILKVGDDISTDAIMPPGAEVLPFRSNIPEIARFVYKVVDKDYVQRARDTGDHAIVGGSNYGQGSSREHAAIAPRYLGLRVVIARDFARIHWKNLLNFGVLPLTFSHKGDHRKLKQGTELQFENLHSQLNSGTSIKATADGTGMSFEHTLSSRQIDVLIAGGVVNWQRKHQR